MTNPRVLIVEDDPAIRAGVVGALASEGYETIEAGDGAAGLERALEPATDLVLLDIMLPEIDGFHVLESVRAQRPRLPVICLTAMGEPADRVRGLRAGADDYIVKPFLMKELFARVRAVLRRIRPGLAEDTVTVGDISIDRVAHRVIRCEQEIHLGPTEFRLLDYLMQHPGRVFSREQLLDAVWGSDVYVEARTVDVHIGRLRKALRVAGEDDPIRTVRSAGYALNAG